MLDKAHIGKTFGRLTTEVEKGRLRFFAKAIGETNPVYTDEAAAQRADYRSLPVPPTYFVCLQMLDDPDPTSWISDIGVNLQHILHGEQSFEYLEMAFAGDSLTFESTITDIYDKKGGALEFVVSQTTVVNQFNKLVARLKSSLVVRNPGGSSK
ncbi:Acyl dehydratase [Collimonas sp. OK307]|uniref:MaoC family dehydratase N-terminal domain-containing protein n=1 Tax=Collimonas sp. OK307 TaxID=1801620 RepID=UPI0008E1103B|nr:MaoC family dehydratase N-terminal domain-containing protein [Collimonas sp. OK307]SFI00257.1 Acyl dehydratase [Collimonas sp. OK307]